MVLKQSSWQFTSYPRAAFTWPAFRTLNYSNRCCSNESCHRLEKPATTKTAHCYTAPCGYNLSFEKRDPVFSILTKQPKRARTKNRSAWEYFQSQWNLVYEWTYWTSSALSFCLENMVTDYNFDVDIAERYEGSTQYVREGDRNKELFFKICSSIYQSRWESHYFWIHWYTHNFSRFNPTSSFSW